MLFRRPCRRFCDICRIDWASYFTMGQNISCIRIEIEIYFSNNIFWNFGKVKYANVRKSVSCKCAVVKILTTFWSPMYTLILILQMFLDIFFFTEHVLPLQGSWGVQTLLVDLPLMVGVRQFWEKVVQGCEFVTFSRHCSCSREN